MKLDEIMQIANKAYGDDDLVACYHFAPGKKHGDTLAEFIAREIKDVFDKNASSGTQLNESAQALRTAIHQLERVAEALSEAAFGWGKDKPTMSPDDYDHWKGLKKFWSKSRRKREAA